MKKILLFIMSFMMCGVMFAQVNDYDDGFSVVDNTFNPNRNAADSLKASHKEVPKGLRKNPILSSICL